MARVVRAIVQAQVLRKADRADQRKAEDQRDETDSEPLRQSERLGRP